MTSKETNAVLPLGSATLPNSAVTKANLIIWRVWKLKKKSTKSNGAGALPMRSWCSPLTVFVLFVIYFSSLCRQGHWYIYIYIHIYKFILSIWNLQTRPSSCGRFTRRKFAKFSAWIWETEDERVQPCAPAPVWRSAPHGKIDVLFDAVNTASLAETTRHTGHTCMPPDSNTCRHGSNYNCFGATLLQECAFLPCQLNLCMQRRTTLYFCGWS